MGNREPDWALYRTFLAVLQEGSLSAAARLLGMTQPTVGRQIESLETQLGFSLFVRTQRGYSPTDDALRIQPYAQTLHATSKALLRAVTTDSGRVEGTVRLTASEVLSTQVLPAILTKIHAQHPGLCIELVASNKVEDLLQRSSDIAVRMVRPTQDVLIAKRVGHIKLGLYAHQDYLARRGMPENIEALKEHALIGFDTESAFTRALSHQYTWMNRQHFALRSDCDAVGINALRAGFGIGVCQVGIAKPCPELVRLFADTLEFKLDTWLAMHEDLRQNRSCQAVFAGLAEGLADYIASS